MQHHSITFRKGSDIFCPSSAGDETMVSFLRGLFSRKRNVWYTGPDKADRRNQMPDWMMRDLGLDNPDNLKAVQVGKCRKPELSIILPVVKLPERP
ncbi:hypothetical protein ACVDG9_09810 [Roseibium sp. RP-7]